VHFQSTNKQVKEYHEVFLKLTAVREAQKEKCAVLIQKRVKNSR